MRGVLFLFLVTAMTRKRSNSAMTNAMATVTKNALLRAARIDHECAAEIAKAATAEARVECDFLAAVNAEATTAAAKAATAEARVEDFLAAVNAEAATAAAKAATAEARVERVSAAISAIPAIAEARVERNVSAAISATAATAEARAFAKAAKTTTAAATAAVGKALIDSEVDKEAAVGLKKIGIYETMVANISTLANCSQDVVTKLLSKHDGNVCVAFLTPKN